MAILGAYEDKGEVVLELSDDPPVRLSWREALTRAQACIGDPSVQGLIEEIIGAAKEARKKDPEQSGWDPPKSVSMYTGGKRADVTTRQATPKPRIILPD